MIFFFLFLLFSFFLCSLCFLSLLLIAIEFSVILKSDCFSPWPIHSCTLHQFLLEGRLRILSPNFWKAKSCRVLVKKSASMFSIEQYATLTSPFWLCLLQYLTFRCQFLLLLDSLLFSDSSIMLLLSWYIVVAGTWTPWAAKKFMVHNI